MHILGTIVVRPVLPKRIARLQELSRNLWWCWTPRATSLFARLGGKLWDELNHNPVALLSHIDQADMEKAAKDASFLQDYDQVMGEFDAYMHPETTRFDTTFPQHKNKIIAYFSAEFGLHESLPIYSGGLGILSGDHMKTASEYELYCIPVTSSDGVITPTEIGLYTENVGEADNMGTVFAIVAIVLCVIAFGTLFYAGRRPRWNDSAGLPGDAEVPSDMSENKDE